MPVKPWERMAVLKFITDNLMLITLILLSKITAQELAESSQANLFKPFFTTKKEGEGTGLGLYLCSTLMNKMNGELIYDNKFKSGSRFILRFKKL